MSVAELRRVVDAGDHEESWRTMLACGERLRAGTEADPAEMEAALVRLREHPSALVRLAVGDVCDAFPSESAYEETHARLIADPDRFVRSAAQRAGDRRAQQRRERARTEKKEQVLADILGEIERRYDKGARQLAERAVDRGVEAFATQLQHEVTKTRDPIEVALQRLYAEVERPERSLGVVGEQVRVLRERIAFAFSVIRRVREYATRIEPFFEAQSLAELVDEARAQLSARLEPARRQTLAFRAEVDGALRPEVDRFALLQALQNLLQNAAEAYPDGAERRTVRVSAEARSGGSEIEVRVADEGVGIGERQRARLFVPFKSDKPGGTGVGLSIVKRMIEDVHGGELSFESAPGMGTTMTIVIPARQAGKRGKR